MRSHGLGNLSSDSNDYVRALIMVSRASHGTGTTPSRLSPIPQLREEFSILALVLPLSPEGPVFKPRDHYDMGVSICDHLRLPIEQL